MKTKILNVNQVLVDKEIYPRFSIDFVTLSKYASAMESGVVFPPICVSFLDGKCYLVDGRHRLEATKMRKEQHISVELFEAKDKKEIYLEAIRRNIVHGKPFSVQEVTNLVITLEKWKLSQIEISSIVHIPVDRLIPFVAKRSVLITDTNGVQGRIGLRKPLTHLSNTVQDSSSLSGQNTLVGADQVHLLETVIKMLKNKWFDLEDKTVMEKLRHLSILLNQITAIVIKPEKTSKDRKDNKKKTKA